MECVKTVQDILKTLEEKATIIDKKDTMMIRLYVLDHHASMKAGTHYDFRIMYLRSNKLASWALPKARLPKNPGDKVIAIRTADHDPVWLQFQGEIPEGEYGHGTVKIAQKGELEIIRWDPKIITFVIKGQIMNGKYSLIKLKKPSYKQEVWILLKRRDDE